MGVQIPENIRVTNDFPSGQRGRNCPITMTYVSQTCPPSGFESIPRVVTNQVREWQSQTDTGSCPLQLILVISIHEVLPWHWAPLPPTWVKRWISSIESVTRLQIIQNHQIPLFVTGPDVSLEIDSVRAYAFARPWLLSRRDLEDPIKTHEDRASSRILLALGGACVCMLRALPQ